MADTANTHQDNYLELERWLDEGQELLNSITDPTFMAVKIRFLKHIVQDKNYIALRTNNVTAIGNHDVGGPGNPLLANGPKMIMGKIVGESSAPVTQESLRPKKDEVKKFKADVQDLYNGFLGLKDNDVAAILSKPNGVTLLRGVAIKAGVSNADSIGTEDMDIAFFADIRQGIKENARGKKLSASLDTKLTENDAAEEEAEDDEEPAPKKAAAKKVVVPAKKAAAKKVVLDDDED